MLPARPAPVLASRPAVPAAQRRGGYLDTTGIRERARAQSIEVKDRGRVPADLVAKFKAATAQRG
jgi:hypothetical protein